MIHDVILNYVRDELQDALIDSIPTDDTARAGIVMLGPLQGDPNPDDARISVTIHENDPDRYYGDKTMGPPIWADEVSYIECGGSITWKRRFTVKARCLLVATQEDLTSTREIASTVRSRIETALLGMSLSGLAYEDEYVSKPSFNQHLRGEMVQAGGPPDAYDYHIKILFEVETTRGVTL